jgi:chromosome segregation ATPase
LQQSVDHVWEEIAAERVGRDALCGRIAQWESEQGTRKERLDKIEQDMGTIRISSQEAESNLLALGERIETESVKRQEMLSAIEQFEDGKQNLGVVLERVEGLQRGLSELQAIQESIGRHEIELGRLKEQLRETGERLVSAAALGDRIERVQCDLEAGLTAIHAELDTIRPELSALRTSMEEPDRQDSEDAAARCGADAGDRDTRIALATSQAETDSGKVSSPEEHEHQDISPGRQVLIGSFFHFMRPSPKVSDLETGGHM